MPKVKDREETYAKSHSYKWWAKKYRQYKRDYYKKVDEMISNGLTPVDAIPANYRDFKVAYAAKRNDRFDDIAQGKRKNIGNINKALISDGVYELSEKQAYSILDYLKENTTTADRKRLGISLQNINLAIAKIRQGDWVDEDLGLWDAIKARRAQLFDAGFSKKDVKAIISQEFFYPKEK